MNSRRRALQRWSARLLFVSAIAVVVLVTTAAAGAALALRTDRHPGRLAIESFTAKPTTLPAKGGRIRLSAIVANARSCRITANTARAFSAGVDCASGRPSISVNVAGNTRTATRTYRFVLRADNGHGASASAAVTVKERGRAAPGTSGAIAITLEPVSETVAAGATASFDAAASGDAASVQWQVSIDRGAAWTNIAGATSSSYSFGAAPADNGYEYRAVFSNQTRTATSSAATLTVTGGTTPPPPARGPQVTAQPAALTVDAATPASFSAASSGSPAPDVQWQVSSDAGASWSNIPGATATTYTLASPDGSDNGDQYRAVFTNSAGTATSNPATLTVDTSPAITSQPADASVPPGTSAAFTAAASGFPTPSAQWQVSTDAGASWSNIPGATAATYMLSSAATADNGNQYRAVFTNSAGTATSNRAALTVDTSPAITGQPAGASVAAGTTVSLTAAASGFPTPTVQWQVSTDAGASWSNIPGATAATYTFTAAGADNGFEYQAIFTNPAGSATTNSATLTITTPEITQQPQNQNVVAGTTASFTAAASGVPAPVVQWQVSTDSAASWSNIPNATSTTYQLAASNADDGHEFRAVFTNQVGTAMTSAVTLSVGFSQSSTNWSGYVDTGAIFSAVSGSWLVPHVDCHATPNASLAVWVGIDGEGGNTVEQDGIEADCSGGSPEYSAWYEMYGDTSVNNGNQVVLSSTAYPVSPGDQITASVSVSGSTWTLTLEDQPAQGLTWTFSTPIATPLPPDPLPAEASAEWIVERPNVCGGMGGCTPAALSGFGTVKITSASATASGKTGSIAAFPWTFTQMTSTSSSAILAEPGPLDPAGETFTDTWNGSA
jgi:hypothetical protein